MHIRMLSTRRGAADGVTSRTYEAGQEYTLPPTPRGQDLAQVFLSQGWAEAASSTSKDPGADLVRLPPLEEYVAAGYDAANYQAFIANRTAQAEAEGKTAVVAPDPTAPPAEPAAPAPPQPEPPAPAEDAAPAEDRSQKGKGRQKR